MPKVLPVAIALLLASGTGARADPHPLPPIAPPPADAPILRPARVPLIIGGNLLVLLPPTLYYFATTNLQREDFELDWDWPSWRMKLTSFDAMALDTGNWTSNAIRHPIAGALSYQVVRASGYGAVTATVIDTAASVFWEYVVEYREQISINDLVVNAAAGFLVGEPLFQLGRIADLPGAGWARTALAWVASPFHRLYAAADYASWRPLPAPWTRLALSLGGGTADHGAARDHEAAIGLDLELVADPRHGSQGHRRGRVRAGGWNRVVVEVRGDDDGVSRVQFRSRTTYGGRSWYDVGPDGGRDVVLDAAAGFDYETRRLADEWDRLAVLHLIGARLTYERLGGPGRATLELGGAADVGMVQAHVFGPVLPFEPRPQHAVLQSRGYYYARGLSATGRLALHADGWHVAVEGRAYQLWSIDGLDRHEQFGAPDDPHDVRDLRLFGRAAVGVDLTPTTRLELEAEAVRRQGAWADLRRRTTETDVGARVVVAF